MRSSSFVFIFILGHIFRNCVKIELYCVLVVGHKKQSSHFSVFKLRPYICSDFRMFLRSRSTTLQSSAKFPSSKY